MNESLPRAVIWGIGHFAARKLADEILKKDINVWGVGEWAGGWETADNFIFAADESQLPDQFDYLFDFEGEDKIWEKVKKTGAKITVICCNNREKGEKLRDKLKGLEANWRLVRAFGVYGPGMSQKSFWGRVMVQAVKNENLVLPSLSLNFRILAVEDLVEAIMRASFLSGTERQDFLVVGKEINSRKVAEVLIEEAKMTRYKVIQSEMRMETWEENEVIENWMKLRWEPVVEFKEGVKETLQYFFSKIDEENRRGRQESEAQKTEKEEALEQVEDDRGGWREVEVVVEDEKEPVDRSEDKIQDLGLKTDKKKKKKKKKAISWEGVVIKNANRRPVKPKSQGLRLVKQEEKEEEGEENVDELKPKIEEKKKKWGWRWLGWVGVGVAGMVLLAGASWARDSWLIYKNTLRAVDLIKLREYKKAEGMINFTLTKVKRYEKRIDNWNLNRWQWLRNYEAILRVGEDVLNLEARLVRVVEESEELGKGVLGEGDVDWERALVEWRRDLEEVNGRMGVLEARLNGDWGWLPSRWRGWPQKGIRELERLRKTIDLALKGIEILPEFLGTDGKRRDYLVLMQNESELRPGGGFVGSLGILSFEDGSLLNFEVMDVYEADGQLKGHVEPPEEIKAYLGEAGWYLRDANWDADFRLVGEKTQWFLQKELGRQVDGVIGLNLAAAKGILTVVGEVYVPDFEEKVNKDNLFEQAEFWAETKFFPGSKQKANFLGGLANQLFEELKNLTAEKRLELGVTLIDLLERNEIQVALNNRQAAKELADLGWDGAMWEGGCAKKDCWADYVYVVEANVGVNKANYFLYRSMEQLVDISKNSVLRVLKINYENTSKNDNWPGGDYKNYLRIYLPKEVNLAQISLIDGNNLSVRKVYKMDELRIRDVGEKREIGFLMVVPKGEKRIVEVRYSALIDLENKDEFYYLCYVQRQSGFGDTGLVSLVSVPEGWQPIQVEPAATWVKGKLLFNNKLDKDMKIGVQLMR